MLNDLLVNLYNLPKYEEVEFDINRVLSPDIHKVQEFIRTHFPETWVSEASSALYQNNPTCYIATHKKEIIGFACFDATAKGYFGPTGVDHKYRGKGIGKALLMKSLYGLKELGYGYAIIGSVGKPVQAFYINTCNAQVIEESNPRDTVYKRMIK